MPVVTDNGAEPREMPAWVLRRMEQLPHDFTGRVELNFHRGKIGSVSVTERVTQDD